MAEKFTPIGKVARPIGRAGRFKVNIYSKGLDTLKRVKSLFVKNEAGDLKQYEIEELALKPASASVLVKGVNKEEKALELKNREVYIDLNELPDTNADEYYHHDLIGSEIFTVEGEYAGVLEGILETKSNDVWCIKKEGKEFLIPAIKNVIKKVDTKNKKISIDPPQGTFDD